MRQYIYNKDTIGKNFLASYADVTIKEGKIFLINILTNRQIMITGENLLLSKLINELRNGVSDEELHCILSELGMQDMVDVLFREGMIE